MKQHITIKQLNELSEKGKERLRKWWKPAGEGGEVYVSDNKTFIYCPACSGEYHPMEKGTTRKYPSGLVEKYYPLLSIGQMIEFLRKENPMFFLTRVNCHGEMVWSVNSCVCPATTTKSEKEATRIHNKHRELADALWEAVKEILER